MHHVSVNTDKNRLYIVFRGNVDDNEATLAADETIKALDLVRPGFTVLTDLANAVPISTYATDNIKRGQLAIARKGVKKVARVVKNIVGAMQFKRVQREAGIDYEVIQVTSMEEAEVLLDKE